MEQANYPARSAASLKEHALTSTDETVGTTDGKEAAIVDAAQGEFLAKGFDGTSMDAIALSANVSKRTVYNRFRSKEELFAATIEMVCRRILPVDVSNLEVSLSPIEFVDRIAHEFVRGILQPEVISLRRIATFEASRKPALGIAYLEHGPKFMVASYAPILERTSARAGLKIDDPVTAIWQMGALITEPLYSRVLLGDVPDDLEAAIDQQIKRGLDAFWRIYANNNLTR